MLDSSLSLTRPPPSQQIHWLYFKKCPKSSSPLARVLPKPPNWSHCFLLATTFLTFFKHHPKGSYQTMILQWLPILRTVKTKVHKLTYRLQFLTTHYFSDMISYYSAAALFVSSKTSSRTPTEGTVFALPFTYEIFPLDIYLYVILLESPPLLSRIKEHPSAHSTVLLPNVILLLSITCITA